MVSGAGNPWTDLVGRSASSPSHEVAVPGRADGGSSRASSSRRNFSASTLGSGTIIVISSELLSKELASFDLERDRPVDRRQRFHRRDVLPVDLQDDRAHGHAQNHALAVGYVIQHLHDGKTVLRLAAQFHAERARLELEVLELVADFGKRLAQIFTGTGLHHDKVRETTSLYQLRLQGPRAAGAVESCREAIHVNELKGMLRATSGGGICDVT